MADERSRAVHLVFRVQDEEDVEGFYEFWVRTEVLLVEVIHHVKEVLDVGEFLAWGIVVAADSVSVGIGGNSGDQP